MTDQPTLNEQYEDITRRIELLWEQIRGLAKSENDIWNLHNRNLLPLKRQRLKLQQDIINLQNNRVKILNQMMEALKSPPKSNSTTTEISQSS